MGSRRLVIPKGLSGGLEVIEHAGKVGHGAFGMDVIRRKGSPVRGGPMGILCPGISDEDGETRVPLAHQLVKEGILSAVGVVRHTKRDALHPRRQRADNVMAACSLVLGAYRPKVLVVAGHSLGGVNGNDAVNLLLDEDLGNTQLVLVEEDTPGTTGNFNGMIPNIFRMAVHEAPEMVRHSGTMAGFTVRRVIRHVRHPRDIAADLTEYGGTHNLTVVEGKRHLAEHGVPVHDIFHYGDTVVPSPRDAVIGRVVRDATGSTVVLRGNHLSSFIDPEPVARHIGQHVLTEHGY